MGLIIMKYMVIYVILIILTFLSHPIYSSSFSSPSPSPTPSPSPSPSSPPSILILGSGGLVGSALVSHLSSVYPHYILHHVRNRTEFDLRVPSSLSSFSPPSLPSPPSFVFFLACEVGGSKYIDNKEGNAQHEIIRSNLAIYNNVFDWLYSYGIPFLFTSSTLETQSTAYGTIKRLGEQWIQSKEGQVSEPLGKIVRLWNIYGKERVGLKSHVLSDWISLCLSSPSAPSSAPMVSSLTNGYEKRQFLHAEDTAKALVSMYHQHRHLDLVTDLSSAQWVSLRDVSALISMASIPFSPSSAPCTFSFSDTQAAVRHQTNPNMNSTFYQLTQFSPSISLEEGIKDLFNYYYKQLNEREKGEEVKGVESGKTSCGTEERGESEQKRRYYGGAQEGKGEGMGLTTDSFYTNKGEL